MALDKLLVGKQILDGKLVPGNVKLDSPNAVFVDSFLGEEQFGEIFIVRLPNQRKQKSFWLKIPAPPLGKTHKYLQNEISKLEILATPGNAHIPRIAQSNILAKDKKLPFYLSCFVVPASIRFQQSEQQQNISHFEALKIFYLLTETVQYLEQQQIVHSSINPSSIQFYDRMPVLTHWETAKSLEEIVTSAMPNNAAIYSDPTWLPPEVFFVDVDQEIQKVSFCMEEVSNKTDIWSLGLVLMNYLSGVKIFDSTGQNIEAIIESISYIYQNKILSQYRNHCRHLLKKHLQFSNSLLEEDQFIREISPLFWSEGGLQKDLEAIDKKLIVKFSLERVIDTCNQISRSCRRFHSVKDFTNYMVGNRNKLSSNQGNFHFLKDFYLDALILLFDMCTAPVKHRVNAGTLVDVLNYIFPGLAREANLLVTKPYIPKLTPETDEPQSHFSPGVTGRIPSSMMNSSSLANTRMNVSKYQRDTSSHLQNSRGPNFTNSQGGFDPYQSRGRTQQGMPSQNMPSQNMPTQNMNLQSTRGPNFKNSQGGFDPYQSRGRTQQGMPSQNMPPQNMPPQGLNMTSRTQNPNMMPPGNNQGGFDPYQSRGRTQQNMPPQNMPPQNMPPQGLNTTSRIQNPNMMPPGNTQGGFDPYQSRGRTQQNMAPQNMPSSRGLNNSQSMYGHPSPDGRGINNQTGRHPMDNFMASKSGMASPMPTVDSSFMPKPRGTTKGRTIPRENNSMENSSRSIYGKPPVASPGQTGKTFFVPPRPPADEQRPPEKENRNSKDIYKYFNKEE